MIINKKIINNSSIIYVKRCLSSTTYSGSILFNQNRLESNNQQKVVSINNLLFNRKHSRIIAKSETKGLKMGEIDGASIIAKALKYQGVEYIFGVVGIPVIEIGMTAQQYGIKYVGCRNEQAAAYAAQAMGYLTGKPAVCLCVSGPGVLHTVAGLANSLVNGWPMILIGGSSDLDQDNRGAFQEYPQLDSLRLHCKHASRPTTLESIPSHIEKAVRCSLYGRPGPVYIDIPGNLVTSVIDESKIVPAPKLPLTRPVSLPPKQLIGNALDLLTEAKKPLVIFGKGAMWSERGPVQLHQFITSTKLPFLSTPGGKGAVPDDHEENVGSARSTALKEADVILLVGARINWMLHFGLPPRFNENAKIIQIDINSEEFHQNIPTTVPLLGDVGETIEYMRRELNGWKFDQNSEWIKTLKNKCLKNKETVEKMVNDESTPLNYYAAYKAIREFVKNNDVLIVNEGANTMDIGRTMMPSVEPRRRLDAGTFGTMGVGLGYALAASLYCRDYSKKTKVLCVQGDSAFGFSGMEIETIIRYKLPVTMVVINNGGIYRGLTADDWKDVDGDPTLNLPVLSLTPEARYDKMCEAFGGKGYLCRTVDEISKALDDATKEKKPSLINILISNDSERKAQEHNWLTRSKM